MPGKRPQPHERSGRKALLRQREEYAWEKAAQGWGGPRIAASFPEAGLGKITQQGVSLMLIRVEKRVLAELNGRVQCFKSAQSARLEFVFQEAMAAWQKSKEVSKAVAKQVDAGAGGGERTTTTVRDQDGDPRFLEQARAAMADLRKIWGLDAPQKVAPTTPDGEQSWKPGVDLSRLTDEELNQLEEMAKRCAGPASDPAGEVPPAEGTGATEPG